MDRRGFVKALGMTGFAVVVSPFIKPDPGWNVIPAVETALKQVGVSHSAGQWVIVVHPDLYQQLQDLQDRGILH